MPLSWRGITYAMVLTGLAIVAAYLVITSFDISDDDAQYAVTMGFIVLFIGLFFTRDSVWIGIRNRAIWSLVLALIVSLILLGNGLFFEHFFGV